MMIQINNLVKKFDDFTALDGVNMNVEKGAVYGLSMSAAFTVFAKKVGREKRIPFEVSVDPFYSDSNIRENT